MARDIQPMGDKQKDIDRQMPLLHVEQYKICTKDTSLTPDEKRQFLEVYYKTGNQTKAAKSCGRDRTGFIRTLETDPAFALDFHTVQQAIKNDLEEVMVQNGMTTKGYMDRITWLRKNFPQEYNPNADRSAKDDTNETIKQLSQKLDQYQLIPKKQIIDVEEEKDDAVSE